MKFIKIIPIILIICLVITSCHDNEVFYTQSICFNERQIEKKELVKSEVSLDEYTQIYRDKKGLTHYFIYSAPLENENCDLQVFENEYIYKGKFVQTKFPKRFSNENGIDIITESKKYSIFPYEDNTYTVESKMQNNIFGLNKKCVIYKNVFGNNTEMHCYYTPFGVNFEIILNEKPKTNKLFLKINMPDLIPEINSPDYIAMNTLYNKTKLIIYSSLAVSNGNWNYQNSVKLVKKENDTYTLEYSLNENLYKSDNSYPIKVNQSILRYTDKQPDTAVYEKADENSKFYLSPYIVMDNKKGDNNTYIRFENLRDLDIDYNNIISAKYVFRNLFNLNCSAKIGAYLVKKKWCSINSIWNNKAPVDNNAFDILTFKKAGDYEINIKKYLKSALKRTNAKGENDYLKRGFMLKLNSQGERALIATGDNGLFSPYLEIVTKK